MPVLSAWPYPNELAGSGNWIQWVTKGRHGVRARLRQREQSLGEAGVGSMKFPKNTLQTYLKGAPSSTLLLIPWFAFL